MAWTRTTLLYSDLHEEAEVGELHSWHGQTILTLISETGSGVLLVSLNGTSLFFQGYNGLCLKVITSIE